MLLRTRALALLEVFDVALQSGHTGVEVAVAVALGAQLVVAKLQLRPQVGHLLADIVHATAAAAAATLRAGLRAGLRRIGVRVLEPRPLASDQPAGVFHRRRVVVQLVLLARLRAAVADVPVPVVQIVACVARPVAPLATAAVPLHRRSKPRRRDGAAVSPGAEKER